MSRLIAMLIAVLCAASVAAQDAPAPADGGPAASPDAQADSIEVRLLDPASGKTTGPSSVPFGKFWYHAPSGRFFSFTRKGLSISGMAGDLLQERAFLGLDGGELSPVRGVCIEKPAAGDVKKAVPASRKARTGLSLASLLKMPKGHHVVAFASDRRDEVFYATDEQGYVNAYKIKNGAFEGRKRFRKQPVRLLRQLPDGSLLLCYDDGVIAVARRDQVPLFSFLQHEMDTFDDVRQLKIGYRFLNHVSVNDTGTLAAVVADHRRIIVIDLVTMTEMASVREKRFIEHVDFAGGSVVYSTTNEVPSVDDPHSLPSHVASMTAFFDMTGTFVVSPAGGVVLQQTGRTQVALFDMTDCRRIAEFIPEDSGFSDLGFSERERYLFVISPGRDRVAAFRMPVR